MRLIDADALEEEIRTKDITGGLNYRSFIENAPTIEMWRQEPCDDIAQERYKDLCEYFGGAKDILESREDFKAWLRRVKWHIRKAGELYKKYEYKKEPCDAISRDMALEKMADYVASGYADSAEDFEEYSKIICQLPSVTRKPIECDDAISREWLKTAIHNFYDGLKHTPTEEDIQAYIDVAPPVTQKSGKWIPVSERLPEQDKTGCSNWHSVKVFAQIKSNINDVWETEIVKGYFIEFDNEMNFSLENFPLCIPDEWDFITLDKDNRAYDEEYSERYVELQAWMPLPEPYREEGDHE